MAPGQGRGADGAPAWRRTLGEYGLIDQVIASRSEAKAAKK
jgi:hypothetical protein